MSFFSNLRADRLITEIRTSTDPASPAPQKAVARLKDVLASLASQKTFPQFLRGLVEGSPRVVSGISWALTSSRNYPPHLLLEALATPGISKSALLEVIAAQK